MAAVTTNAGAPAAGPRKLRILSIAHGAVSDPLGRRRYDDIARRDDVELLLVAPRDWREYGRATLAQPPKPDGPNMRLLPIRLPAAGPFKWYLHHYIGLGEVVRAFNPDVIHLWEEPWSLVALQALRLRGEAAYILEVDQNILKTLPPPFEAIRRYVLGRCDWLLSRSEEADAVVRARGYGGGLLRIGYGVDTALFRPEGPARPPAGPLKLAYIGRLIVEKGLDDALEALAAGPAGAELAIMGEGPHKPALQARVAALGLQARVRFQGWGDWRAVGDFMRAADATLLLTRTTGAVKEQFGRVIIESQACGVPVIGSTCGAIPDVVAEGGWIVPERDPQALAALLLRLDRAREAFPLKSAAGLANVESRFTFGQVAEQFVAGCRAAAAAHRAGGPLPTGAAAP